MHCKTCAQLISFVRCFTMVKMATRRSEMLLISEVSQHYKGHLIKSSFLDLSSGHPRNQEVRHRTCTSVIGR